MTPVEQQLLDLRKKHPSASLTRLPSGGHLVSVPNVKLPPGWNRPDATILFVAPAAYPNGKPDCFWVEPSGMRLQNGGIPQGTNDLNAIPEVAGRKATWFSWHLQGWNPNSDSLSTYLQVVLRRLGMLQ